MDRTISVIGEAEISAKPDTVVLDLSVSAHERDYEPTARAAAEQADRLYGAVRKAGFSDSDLKTADFSVNTAYKNVRDENGNYGSVFDGYRFVQRFTLEFPTDMARLAQTLSYIGSCGADPDVRISFTVRDTEMLKERLLTECTVSARKKAEILCRGLGVMPGEVISVKCGDCQPDFMSATGFSVGDGVMPLMAKAGCAENMTPEDVKISESVSFVFGII